MGEAKTYNITFYFVGGTSETYAVAPTSGIIEIKKTILNEKWYEVTTNKKFVNLENVTHVEISD